MGETEGLSGQYSRQSFPLEIVYLNRSTDIAILRPTKAAVLTPLPVDCLQSQMNSTLCGFAAFPSAGRWKERTAMLGERLTRMAP